MRKWNLGEGDPLALTLAADFRLGKTDPTNDHIWDMEIGGGDPSAIALRTTFGLRARNMRIFPRFLVQGSVFCDPNDFFTRPKVRGFGPNFMTMEYFPCQGLLISAETWIPDSQTLAGRLEISNMGNEQLSMQFDLCGKLSPIDGQPLRERLLESVHILSGRTMDLFPVVFLTGGPTPSGGPYPALAIDLVLAPGGKRILTWVEAALGTEIASFNHARRTAARSWEAERARMELVHGSQMIEVQCGEADWDAAFAFSQKNGFSLFLSGVSDLPEPMCVRTRQPDGGWYPEGTQYNEGFLGNCLTPLECAYLAQVLPGAPGLSSGLARNFLSKQEGDGAIPWNPCQPDGHRQWLPHPLLTTLTWPGIGEKPDREALKELVDKIELFVLRWLDTDHDRDGDGFPEWHHSMQLGLDELPDSAAWQKEGVGADMRYMETPALGAMLYKETLLLKKMAVEAGMKGKAENLSNICTRLSKVVEECWDQRSSMYLQRDRDSHHSPHGKPLGVIKGEENLNIAAYLPFPTRLVLVILLKKNHSREISILIEGKNQKERISEVLEKQDIHWFGGEGRATTQTLFTEVDSIQVKGVEKDDRINLRVMDLRREDISLFLPLWAGIPHKDRATRIVNNNLLPEKRFGRAIGIPCSIPAARSRNKGEGLVQPIWNALIAEGLLAYGFQKEALNLLNRLMRALILNLKQQRSFYQSYGAQTGAGKGGRNPAQGLAPLGLFLKLLGVEFCKGGQVVITGKNPFPWPVTVQYRGTLVTRREDITEVSFPGGQSITLSDPTYAILEA